MAGIMPGFRSIPQIPYPNTSASNGPDLSTIASFLLIVLFAVAIAFILKSGEQKLDWDDNQWREWWDRPTLPDEPDPDGGLDIPKEEKQELISAVGRSAS